MLLNEVKRTMRNFVVRIATLSGTLRGFRWLFAVWRRDPRRSADGGVEEQAGARNFAQHEFLGDSPATQGYGVSGA